MPPPIKDTPDLSELRESIKVYLAYMESAERNEDVDGDYENLIFEAALEAYCGKSIWDFINSIKV